MFFVLYIVNEGIITGRISGRSGYMRTNSEVCGMIGRCALESMLYEVSATPKPGLVDRANQGAHLDMDFFSFMASSAALAPYFVQCALKGAEFSEGNIQGLLQILRPIGMEAEKAMFRATGGINTHKGLVFSLGIVSAAAAYCWKEKAPSKLNVEDICEKVSRMTRGLCSQELIFLEKTEGLTYGERIYKKYGSKGIRGEVEAGFPTVRTVSLPEFEKLYSSKNHHINDILVQTLLHLLAVNEDTNVLARQDKETLDYVKNYAYKVLDIGGIFTDMGRAMVYEMDMEFIRKNISPGGSADLLAVTMMFHLLSCDIG
jgi:triphosphoribosyl-dephospho-CoA synthase